VGGSIILEIALGLSVVLTVWIVCRTEPFPIGLSAVLVGGLLVSHHLTASDWALTLPLGLPLALDHPARPVRLLAMLVMSSLVLYQVSLPSLGLLGLLYALNFYALAGHSKLRIPPLIRPQANMEGPNPPHENAGLPRG
jgi:hypothetical protein